MFNRVLVVCIGNICRSPTAECLLHNALHEQGITVSSAGLGALVGHAMDKQAHAVLESHGFSWQKHQAQQINSDLIHQNDLILVMEQSHIRRLHSIAPEARGKTFLLSHWVDKDDIADPYKRSDTFFQHVYRQIESGCSSWAKRLLAS